MRLQIVLEGGCGVQDADVGTQFLAEVELVLSGCACDHPSPQGFRNCDRRTTHRPRRTEDDHILAALKVGSRDKCVIGSAVAAARQAGQFIAQTRGSVTHSVLVDGDFLGERADQRHTVHAVTHGHGRDLRAGRGDRSGEVVARNEGRRHLDLVTAGGNQGVGVVDRCRRDCDQDLPGSRDGVREVPDRQAGQRIN